MGLPKAVYDLYYVVGFALMSAVTLRRCKKQAIPRNRGIAYVVFTFFGGVLGAMLMGRIYTAASRAAGAAEVSYVAIFGAVMFTPLFLLAALYLEKRRDPAVSPARVMDLITPGSFLVVICGKTGCFLYGCCYGVPCEHGVFDPLAGERVFPVQLCEVASMLAILAIVWAFRRTRFFADGMEYPLTAALYAAARFGWEYLRGYAPAMRRLIGPLTLWQFCCVLVFIASASSLVVLARKKRREALENATAR